ncbi:pentatricopeptide repeat-containing protein At2g22410, mitochondrial-like [Neltuma alba]|uniref:pentatricopeptide repeat-containing protein At2g22410, mitochondrial-like n=1 Tax=Neltuma alba TaxID=207710 RepID=UPI0010A4178F|nr:pentatricopeptide repeat-containing protein At2g22410, mitochondrial-like [Prosopis alba]
MLRQFGSGNKSLNALLRSCKTINEALQIHAQVIVNGRHDDLFVLSGLISFFALSGSRNGLQHSRALFSQIYFPDVFIWNAMIRGYSLGDTPEDAIFLYKSMLDEGVESPNEFTFPFLLKSSVRLSRLQIGRQVHCQILKNGFGSDTYIVNALLHMYCTFRDMKNACYVFEESPVRDLVSYNTMITGYAQGGLAPSSLQLFNEMRELYICPDEYTIVALLSACSSLADPIAGKQIHCLAYIILGSVGNNILLMNTLVDMYAKCGFLKMAERVLSMMGTSVSIAAWTSVVSGYALCGDIEVARRIFDQMDEQDIVSCTVMINSYSRAGFFQEALELFVQLEDMGIQQDVISVVAALSACARLGALELGRRIHLKYAKTWSFGEHGDFTSAAVDMYAKCGDINTAMDIFRKTPDNLKTTLLYNSIISGLAHHGLGKTAMTIFEDMKLIGLRPNEITFVAILSACGHSGLVEEGKKLFESMMTICSINPKIEHYGCMVDLFGRAGCLNEAYDIIKSMPYKPNSVIWRALLGACKTYGDVELAKIAGQELLAMEPYHGARYVMLSNMLADTDQHEEASRVREAIDDVVIQKPPGWSYVEVNGSIRRFVASQSSRLEDKATALMLRDMYIGLKSIGHVFSASRMVFDID